MTPFLNGFTDELVKTGGVSKWWRLPKSKRKLEGLKITESLKRRGLTPEQGYRIQEAAYGAARRGKRKVRMNARKRERLLREEMRRGGKRSKV